MKKRENVFYKNQKRNMSNRIHYSSKKEFVLGLLKPKDESLLVWELEGVEPSSKRGSHTLSTCLSSPKFSSISRTEATNL